MLTRTLTGATRRTHGAYDWIGSPPPCSPISGGDFIVVINHHAISIVLHVDGISGCGIVSDERIRAV